MFERITRTDTPPSLVLTQRHQIAQIVAHESAETLVGRPAGFRVEVVRRLIRPVADHVAGRFVTYDRALGEAGLRHGSAWVVDEAAGGPPAQGPGDGPGRGPPPRGAHHPGPSRAGAPLPAPGRGGRRHG